MNRAGGGFVSLPFFAFLDGAGATIVNSIRPGAGPAPTRNIGHPVEPNEIDWFLEMVKKAAPAISAGESGALEHWLRTQKK